MKYLLASDLDGTIYRKGKPLPEDLAMLREWQRQGHLFCLCSGRAPKAGIAEMEKCGLCPDLLITGNGAAGVDMSGRFCFRHYFPDESIQAVYRIAQEYHCSAINAQTGDGTLLMHAYNEPERTNISIEELLQTKGFLQFNAVFKGYPEDAEAFTRRVNSEVKDVTAHPNGVYIDCSARGVNKGTGVAEAAAHFGIPADCCRTVGDNQNDLPMLLPYRGAVISDGDPETIRQVGHAVPHIAAWIREILSE